MIQYQKKQHTREKILEENEKKNQEEIFPFPDFPMFPGVQNSSFDADTTNQDLSENKNFSEVHTAIPPQDTLHTKHDIALKMQQQSHESPEKNKNPENNGGNVFLVDLNAETLGAQHPDEERLKLKKVLESNTPVECSNSKYGIACNTESSQQEYLAHAMEKTLDNTHFSQSFLKNFLQQKSTEPVSFSQVHNFL